jgi:hypothetical protein
MTSKGAGSRGRRVAAASSPTYPGAYGEPVSLGQASGRTRTQRPPKMEARQEPQYDDLATIVRHALEWEQKLQKYVLGDAAGFALVSDRKFPAGLRTTRPQLVALRQGWFLSGSGVSLR